MAIGPGKYDDACTLVREYVGLTEETGGGVILIVVGGKHGNGFSMQADLDTSIAMPDILENILKQLRGDVIGISSDDQRH